MPRIGIPSSKIAGSHWGAPGAYTLAGPPEKIKPRGFISATRAAGRSWRTSWQKTFCSRTRRAISWPYWAPKSRISTRSLAGSGVMASFTFRTNRDVGSDLAQFLGAARGRLHRVDQRPADAAALQGVQPGDGR